MSTISEQLRLAGVGVLPTPPAIFARVGSKAQAEPLTEGRSMTLFKGIKEMRHALNRAYHLISRVNATVNSQRESSSRSGAMNDMAQVRTQRLDQEIATAMDACLAANEALSEMDAAIKRAKREARMRRS